ncbi:MAG: ATP-binding protein [archaeon]|nr:MAG: ATP-binding protein [archaeon]
MDRSSKNSDKNKNDFSRLTSGIPGLDNLMNGGFIKGHNIVLIGPAGAGKTIFCCQFLWEGLQKGENCMYITFEELPEEIKIDAEVFGWDFGKYEKSGNLIITHKDPFQTTDITTRLENEIRQSNISRIVIDSVSLLGLYFKNPHDIRRELYKLISALKSANATAVLTAETREELEFVPRFGVEEYVADSSIVLFYTGIGESGFRSIQIRKMRNTKHSTNTHPFEITKKGIMVHRSQI